MKFYEFELNRTEQQAGVIGHQCVCGMRSAMEIPAKLHVSYAFTALITS